MERSSKKKAVFALQLFIIILFFAGRAYGTISIFSTNTGGGEDMVKIPAGPFIMGSNHAEVETIRKKYGKRGDFVGYDFKSEEPRRTVFLKEYYIDRYEVTNARYKTFLDATGNTPPRLWFNGDFKTGKGNFPVIMVNWFDANAYCQWVGNRLPTEAEWEKASRGEDGRVYPWGSTFDFHKARTAEAMLITHNSPLELSNFAAPVNEFKGDRSPYGVYDMTGNVMEWTSSWYKHGNSRVVKGAAWVHLGARARSASRVGIDPYSVGHFIGFRCVKDIKSNH